MRENSFVCTFWCYVSRADVKKPFVQNWKQNQCYWVLLYIYQSVVTWRLDHNPTDKYQVSLLTLIWYISYMNCAPLSRCIWMLKIPKIQHAKHFEKANIDPVVLSLTV